MKIEKTLMILKLKLWITAIEKERANQNGQSRDTDNIRHKTQEKTKKYKQETEKINKTEHQRLASHWSGINYQPTDRDDMILRAMLHW